MKRSREDIMQNETFPNITNLVDTSNQEQDPNNPDKLRRMNPMEEMQLSHNPNLNINEKLPNTLTQLPLLEPNLNAMRSSQSTQIPFIVSSNSSVAPQFISLPQPVSIGGLSSSQLPPLSLAQANSPGLHLSSLSSAMPPLTQALQQSAVASMGGPNQLSVPPSPPMLKQNERYESALDFLDQVKLQFADNPKVYNQFLDIMKDFKSQAIDTPGVIARVTELFKGHRNLILGFNNFLPPGYKIEYPEDQPAPQMIPPPRPPPPAPASLAQAPPPNMQRRQPEFDQARNYVKKIKMRFALQPLVYKSFLEILHTYHKEQHTIKDVYEQVANLFQDHPDLLEEFTQFLPDPLAQQTPPPVSASAPVRGNKKIPTRKAKAEKVVHEKIEKPERPDRHSEKMERERVERERPERPVREVVSSIQSRKAKQRAREQQLQQQKAELPPIPIDKSMPTGTHEEINFFFRVKQRLNNQSLYYEFLKCLNLFSQGILTRLELAILVRDLLGKHRDLFEWFREFIGFDDTTLEALEKAQDDKPAAQTQQDIDFKQMKRYGPSYRALPKDYTSPVCSGRSELCTAVLNDTWVSVPTGSEDYGFKNLRKNQYEEMLFKCEDDRFELDLVIELNASTLRVLEPIVKQFGEMNDEEIGKFRLDSYLDVLHLRSIERIYGDKGQEVIDAMFTNPVQTIPIIVRRLKQKDQEWTRGRREWNKIWREVNEKNYYKSLDHQSFYFKQNDKKNLTPKVLIAEIKQKYAEELKDRELVKQKGDSSKKKSPSDSMEVDIEEVNKDASYHLMYQMTDQTVFGDVFDLIAFCAEKNTNKADREKMETFIKHFLKIFFYLGDSNSQSVSEVNSSKMEVESTKPSTSSTNGDDKTPAKSDKIDSNIFFGNNSFYVFFRMFEVLYERLFKAKDLSKKQSANYTAIINANKSKSDEQSDKYKQFLKLLYHYLSGNKESGAFEDELRAIYGIQAYLLFTLDRVILQLTKHLQSLLSEEPSGKLLALFSHHQHQAKSTAEGNRSLYYTRCVEILEDERIFNFEFQKSPVEGDFSIRLLDPVNNPPQYIDFAIDKQEKWAQYVEKYLGNDEVFVDPQKNHVFLTRSKNPEIDVENLEVENGLECRISLSNFKLFFVENTEDFMYRKKKSTEPKTSQTKQERTQNLQQVLLKKFGEVQPIEG